MALNVALFRKIDNKLCIKLQRKRLFFSYLKKLTNNQGYCFPLIFCALLADMVNTGSNRGCCLIIIFCFLREFLRTQRSGDANGDSIALRYKGGEQVASYIRHKDTLYRMYQ